MVPGEKFSTTTSAFSISFHRAAQASGCFRLRAIERLLRLMER
jgi:hypothetical protein